MPILINRIFCLHRRTLPTTTKRSLRLRISLEAELKIAELPGENRSLKWKNAEVTGENRMLEATIAVAALTGENRILDATIGNQNEYIRRQDEYMDQQQVLVAQIEIKPHGARRFGFVNDS